MKLIVGIDFGTSTTVVRYREEGTDVIQSVTMDNGKSGIIPTAIFRPKDGGTAEYGTQAIQRYINGIEGEMCINFKMDLLNPEKRAEAEKNIIDFLSFIHSAFEEQTKTLHPDVMDVYISYPAKWSDDMVTFMKTAVEEAGFRGYGVTVKGMREPQAASLNMLHEYKQQLQQANVLMYGKPLRVLMLDMGAGTSDISIFKLEIDHEGGIKISELLSYPSISEPILCGGREIDASMQKYFIDMCKDKGFELMPDCVEPVGVKNWKENTLSRDLKLGDNTSSLPSNVALFLKMMKRTDIINGFSINRHDFERVTATHWKRLYKLIQSAFAQYKFAKPEDIDLVFLTGGHSNWYVVPNLFDGKWLPDGIDASDALDFKKIKAEPNLRMADLNNDRPHECVARGLCLADEHVEFEPRSANNVWAKIAICGECGELVQVVSKDGVLPQTQHVEFKKTLERNACFGSLQFDAGVNIYTGENMDDAEERHCRLCINVGKLGKRIIDGLFLFPMFVPMEYNVSVSMDVTMTEEGVIKISGTFKCDDDDSKDFTEENLVTKTRSSQIWNDKINKIVELFGRLFLNYI